MRFLLGLLSAYFGGRPGRLLGSLEAKAAVLYVGGVQKAREAFIALLLAVLFLLLLMTGFLLMHVAIFLWLPWSIPARAIVLLVLGAVYFGCGLAVVLMITSERTWMKFTGVNRLVARLQRH